MYVVFFVFSDVNLYVCIVDVSCLLVLVAEPVPEPEEWDCSCGHHNLAGVKFCAECGKKRN